MRIKDWDKYQHYKPKNPKYQAEMGWFKVYGRQILNDPKWFSLNYEQQAMLFQFWCLASQFEGRLPDMEVMSFRLRKDERFLTKIIKELDCWVEEDSEIDVEIKASRNNNERNLPLKEFHL